MYPLVYNKNEPRHDKTNKMSVSPAKIQISLGIRPVWSDWADAQADLSLRWAHTHFVGFVMSRHLLSINRKHLTGNNQYAKVNVRILSASVD